MSEPPRYRFGVFERLVLRALVCVIQNQVKAASASGFPFTASGFPELISELQDACDDKLNTKL